jgi:hypothetical protein
MMDKVQKSIDSECYTPSSELFRIFNSINNMKYCLILLC